MIIQISDNLYMVSETLYFFIFSKLFTVRLSNGLKNRISSIKLRHIFFQKSERIIGTCIYTQNNKLHQRREILVIFFFLYRFFFLFFVVFLFFDQRPSVIPYICNYSIVFFFFFIYLFIFFRFLS